MKIIERLSEMIAEEIEDAEKYAKCALNHKGENTMLSDLFYSLSLEEMNHMNKLHNAVVTIIQDYRNTKGEPPASMLAVYDYLHKKQIDHAAEVKAMQSMYRDQ